jgi:hypothetical protein
MLTRLPARRERRYPDHVGTGSALQLHRAASSALSRGGCDRHGYRHLHDLLDQTR